MLKYYAVVIITLVITMCVSFIVAGEMTQWGVVERPSQPIHMKAWNSNAKLWLGRSCVGEAGFEAHNECIAIAWVYATRYREISQRKSFEQLIRKYSSAVKKHRSHKRPWIMNLNLNGDRPHEWPDHLNWQTVHRPLWLVTLAELDEWSKGNRPNPVPTANHFGGLMDTPGSKWVRIFPADELKFNNIFYYAP